MSAFASLRAAAAALALWPVLWLAAALPAQGEERLRAELARLQRDAEQRQAEAEQLLEERIRHDLGLPPAGLRLADTPAAAAAAATSEALDRGRAELAREDAATASLLGRAKKLEAQLEAARAAAQALAEQRRREEEWITVPAPGTKPDGLADPPDPERAASQETSGGGEPLPRDPAAPAGEGAADAAVRLVPNLDPVRARIQGTGDHARVAAALFRAAQSLADRGAGLQRQGHAAAAKDVDALAQEKLVRALVELEPVLALDRPPLAALFLQGRCRELAFRLDERAGAVALGKDGKEYRRREQEVREPFLQIAARDVTKQGDRKTIEVLGEWGRAAQAALEHFRWLNVHAGYRPKTPLESIRWDGTDGTDGAAGAAKEAPR